jgi:hypothetical protein
MAGRGKLHGFPDDAPVPPYPVPLTELPEEAVPEVAMAPEPTKVPESPTVPEAAEMPEPA